MWEIAKALQIPLDNKVTTLTELPYTISYVIRKRLQVSSLQEMPKDKRVPEMTIWDGSAEEIEEWIKKNIRKGGRKKVEIITERYKNFIGYKKIVGIFIQVVTDKTVDWNARISAAYALGNIGKDNIEVLNTICKTISLESLGAVLQPVQLSMSTYLAL